MATFTLKTGETVIVDKAQLSRIRQYPWHIVGNGYVGRSLRVKGKRSPISAYLHHLIFGRVIRLDHKNGNIRDNRRCNLMPEDGVQNAMKRKKRKNTTSRFKGVSWHSKGNCWVAQAGPVSKDRYLGCFKSEIKAAKAYDRAVRKMYGKIARTNFRN